MADHNEAMRLADELAGDQLYGLQRRCRDEAAALLRQQAELIAELEGEVMEQARCNGMGAERELALMAERDQHQATATALIALLADIRKACGDNGKRMQPELVEFIGAMSTERDQLREEVERLRAPLSEEQIWFLTNDGMRNAAGGIYESSVIAFARAVERAHLVPAKGPA